MSQPASPGAPSAVAILCPKGASEYLQQELAELGLSVSVNGPEWVLGELTEEQVTHVIRRSLLATRVLALLGRAQTVEELLALTKHVHPTDSFAVVATGPDRQELQETIGGAIKEATNAPVNLRSPTETYLVIDLDGEFLFGKALSSELTKRHYKIITGALSLAGPVAAAILSASGWNPKKDLLVWPCATGELAIEAALRATQKSPRAYELQYHEKRDPPAAIIAADPKLALVATAQKNAKVAGVQSSIRFSRQDLDWLDTKHDEREIEYLVGLLPNLKLYPSFTKELFYQLDFILASKGTACFACVNDDTADILESGLAAAERSYEARRTYVWSGKSVYTLVLITAQGARKKRPLKP